jgi:hypothetical protein
MSADAVAVGAMPSGIEISPVRLSMAGGVADPQT